MSDRLISCTQELCEEKLQRTMSIDEFNTMCSLCNGIDTMHIAPNMAARKITEYLLDIQKTNPAEEVKSYMDKIFSEKDDNVATTQLKQESKAVEIRDFLNFVTNDALKIITYINPNPNLVTSYVALDTDYCNKRTMSQFSWLFGTNQGQSVNGSVQLVEPLSNVVAIRMQRVTVAHVILEPLYLLQSKRIGFSFSEINDGFVTNAGTFQFVEYMRFSTDKADNSIVLSGFTQNRGWFRINNPQQINSLTLNMKDIVNNADILLNTDDEIDVPAYFINAAASGSFYASGPTYSVVGIIALDAYTTALMPVEYAGDGTSNQVDQTQVTISGMTTDNPGADAAFIAAMNATHSLSYLYADQSSKEIRHIRSIAYPPTGVSSPYFGSPVDPTGATINSSKPITLTFNVLKKPRMTIALEIISSRSVPSKSSGVLAVSSNQ